jgi:hypothetical protein
MGLELFVAFLCCLSFSMLFCSFATSFMILHVLLLFLSSEYSLSCVIWLYIHRVKMVDASNLPSCPPPHFPAYPDLYHSIKKLDP